MEKNKKKIKLYDTTFIIATISFVLFFLMGFIFPGESLTKTSFLIPWYILLITWIMCGTIFTIGMIINAYKIKKYGWMATIILLGPIFPIIFYFFIMREEFKKKIISKNKNYKKK